jgi:prevent-host-death family protein
MYIVPVTIEISMTEARAQLADLANRVVYGGERVVLTRHGRPFVALISADDLASLGSPPLPNDVTSSSEPVVSSPPQTYPMPIAATDSPPSAPS